MTLATIPRYDPEATVTGGDRAVVAGAGVAGLCAARVLADGFEEVVVLDPDPPPDDPSPRPGVPQSSHVHALIEAGRATFEDFFPGYGRELVSEGGLIIDRARDFQLFDEGGFLADGERSRPMYCASRPLHEHVIRGRVAGLAPVEFRSGRVVDLLTDDNGATATGVAVRNDGGSSGSVSTDLVVDATGRTSKTPTWLEANGYDPPPVDEVRMDVSYSTLVVERPPTDRRLIAVLPSPPRTRGGTAHPIEDGRWLVTLIGTHGDEPPVDPADCVALAADFPTPRLHRLLEANEIVSETAERYPFPTSIRRRYERLGAVPDRFVALGDAVASFNPVYGQGMSVAALEALVLHHELTSDGLAGLPRRFFSRVAGLVDTAWSLSVAPDRRFGDSGDAGGSRAAALDWYLTRVIRAARDDPALSDAVSRVLMMERPPRSLLRPRVVARVMAGAV